MKNFKILFVCISFLLVSFQAQAEDYTFPAGSLIIPMDKLNQNNSSATESNGIFQAYGYILELLNRGVTVFWCIDPDKVANDQPDFYLKSGTGLTVVRGNDVKPSGSPTTHVGTVDIGGTTYTYAEIASVTYAGGPFVIDANVPEDITTALSIRDGTYPGQIATEFDGVVIHQVDSGNFSAPVGQVLASTPPAIGLLDTGGENLDTLTCYLSVAGVPSDYWKVITPGDLGTSLNTDDFYILWIPHWDNPDASHIASIKSFMDRGGDVLVMCNSIDAFEANDPIMVGTTLGRNTATHNSVYADYRHFDITPSQIGDFLQFTPDQPDALNLAADLAAHTFSYRHIEDSLNWKGGTSVIAWDNYDADLGGKFTEGTNPESFNSYGKAWAYFAHRKKDGDPEKGDAYYLAGHSYASCFGGGAGTVYRLGFQMSACDKSNKTAFWENTSESFTMTLNYTVNGVPGSIKLGPVFQDEFHYDNDFNVLTPGNNDNVNDQYLEIYTQDGHQNTNFGPGCQGGGNARGSDQLDGLFVRKNTDDIVVITRMIVDWNCNCSEDYHMSIVDIRLDNGACGTAYSAVGNGGKLYHDPGNGCNPGDQVDFVPNGFNVTGEGANSSAGQVEDIAGLRYILNTILPSLGTGPEFGKSTPVATDDAIYFGTYTFPGNYGHFRKWITHDDNLTVAWDTADKWVDNPDDRVLYTSIDGDWVSLTEENATRLLPYTSADLTTIDVETYVKSFREQLLGGIERSSPALLISNKRVDPDNQRQDLAFVNTTFGIMELINMDNGTEFGGYVPLPLLKRLKFTGRLNALRPMLNSSPTSKDLFLPNSLGNFDSRSWKSYVVLSLNPDPGFEVLDFTGLGSGFSYKWGVTDSTKVGIIQRASIGQYRKQNGDEKVLGYVVVVTSTLPEGSVSNGIQIDAYDVETGKSIWSSPFQATYTGDVQDVVEMPPFAALWDSDGNGFEDTVLAGDLQGRIWEIDLETGLKPTGVPGKGSGTPTAIINASTGGIRPLGAAVSVGTYDSRSVIGFGTSGVDWAPSDTNSGITNFVGVYDLTDRGDTNEPKLLLKVDIGGRKVYAPVVFAGEFMFFVAISGDLNSPDPRDNLVNVNGEQSQLYSVNLASVFEGDTEGAIKAIDVDKTYGNVFVKNGQLHSSTLDGNVQKFGKKKSQKGMDNLRFLYWKLNSGPAPKVDISTQ